MQRNLLFGAFALAMAAVTVTTPRTASPPSGLHVQVAWLAERESVVGDWSAVRPPLATGDELQLTLRSDEDAVIYVIAESDGARRVIFPPAEATPDAARVRAGWSYAVPGPHRTWRLDGAAHDRLFALIARHPLADPLAALDRARTVTATQAMPDLALPLRDGRPGLATARALTGDELAADELTAR